jgi:hypothetical protein
MKHFQGLCPVCKEHTEVIVMDVATDLNENGCCDRGVIEYDGTFVSADQFEEKEIPRERLH